VRWSAPPELLPVGVGNVTVVDVPNGSAFLRATANLATLSHGHARAKLGTLEPERLGQVIEQFPEYLWQVAPGLVSGHLEDHKVTRFDPSSTYLPEMTDSSALMASAAVIARRRSGPQSPGRVYFGSGDTVSFGPSTRTRKAYQKDKEARTQGMEAPAGLIRAETVVRPTGRKAMTLDDLRKQAESLSLAEIEYLGQWLTEAAASMEVLAADSFIAGQRSLGEEPNPSEALRLAGLLPVLSTEGLEGLMRYMSRASAYRARKRIEELTSASVAFTPAVFADRFGVENLIPSGLFVMSDATPQGKE
jgi:hypothetical protein